MSFSNTNTFTMVNELELHVKTFKDTFSEFLNFLNESLKDVKNKSELTEYLNYVQNTNDNFNKYINKLNPENAIHLFGLIRGVCRYYSEFNWFDDYGFHTKAQYYKNKLSQESQFIYDYFQTESPT